MKLSSRIFEKVYSDEKIQEIYSENAKRRVMKSLRVYTKAMKNQELPKSYRFYYYGEIWAENLPEMPAKVFQKLRTKSKEKVAEFYMLKAFYILQ
jgi:hypothetical protein